MGDKKETRQIPFIYNGLFGGTAGALGMVFLQPADVLKTRMQVLGASAKGSFVLVAKNIVKEEGIKGLYRGLSCSILRQYTYGLTRFCIFYNLVEVYKKKYFEPPNFLGKLSIGMVAGGAGAVVGTPAEVALVRMQADGNRPPDQRRNYTGVFNALFRITKEEGVRTLWSGVATTVTRCVVVTAAELGTYNQARESLMKYVGEGFALHLYASMIAGLVASVVSSPVDIIKTRVQNSKTPISQFTVLKDILRNEGVLSLWSGLLPMSMRIGPHCVFQFVFFEQMFIMYWKYVDYQQKIAS